MIVVIAIGAVWLWLDYHFFSSFRNSKIVDISMNQILSVINEARVKTDASEDYSRFGVRPEAGRVVLFKEIFLQNRALPMFKQPCLLWWK